MSAAQKSLATIPARVVGLVVLDESKSMKRFGNAPLEALNRYILSLSLDPNASNISVGIITFSDAHRVLVKIQPISGVGAVERYQPRGGTRLYGTLLDVFMTLFEMDRHGFEGNVILSCFTDGDDSRSQDLLDELRLFTARTRWRNWPDLYLYGIGVNAASIAREMGFPDDDRHAITVGATSEQIGASMRHASTVTSMASRGIRGRPITVPYETVAPSIK